MQFYSPPNVDDRVDREIIKFRNMHKIIRFYSPADVDDRVHREGEKK